MTDDIAPEDPAPLRMNPDWTGQKLGDFCGNPHCRAGMGGKEFCQCCGWPDQESSRAWARKRSALVRPEMDDLPTMIARGLALPQDFARLTDDERSGYVNAAEDLIRYLNAREYVVVSLLVKDLVEPAAGTIDMTGCFGEYRRAPYPFTELSVTIPLTSEDK